MVVINSNNRTITLAKITVYDAFRVESLLFRTQGSGQGLGRENMLIEAESILKLFKDEGDVNARRGISAGLTKPTASARKSYSRNDPKPQYRFS